MSTANDRLYATLLGLLVAAPAAFAQGGLRVGDEVQSPQALWPHWQARFGLTPGAGDPRARWQLGSGQLLGDYYWRGLRPAGAGIGGGFRATSGLLFSQRSLALSAPPPSFTAALGQAFARGVRFASGPVDGPVEPWAAVPYFGVGYSGISLRGGWGFTADVGFAGNTGGLRTRREGALGVQSVDDLLRELRLTPVFQFGATYAF
jgi:hypothetical protein